MLGLPCAGDGASVCQAPRGGVPLRPCRPSPVASLILRPACWHARHRSPRPVSRPESSPRHLPRWRQCEGRFVRFQAACPGAPGFRRVGLAGGGARCRRSTRGHYLIAYRFHLAATAAAAAGAAGSSLLAEGRKSLSPSLLGAVVSVPTLASRRAHLDSFAIPLPWLRINRANCLRDLRVAPGGIK